MRSIKEGLFAIVSIATVAIGGMGCVAVFEKYLPAYQLLAVPMMIYAWVLGGYGMRAIDKRLKEKWDYEDEKIRKHQEWKHEHEREENND